MANRITAENVWSRNGEKYGKKHTNTHEVKTSISPKVQSTFRNAMINGNYKRNKTKLKINFRKKKSTKEMCNWSPIKSMRLQSNAICRTWCTYTLTKIHSFKWCQASWCAAAATLSSALCMHSLIIIIQNYTQNILIVFIFLQLMVALRSISSHIAETAAAAKHFFQSDPVHLWMFIILIVFIWMQYAECICVFADTQCVLHCWWLCVRCVHGRHNDDIFIN